MGKLEKLSEFADELREQEHEPELSEVVAIMECRQVLDGLLSRRAAQQPFSDLDEVLEEGRQVPDRERTVLDEVTAKHWRERVQTRVRRDEPERELAHAIV